MASTIAEFGMLAKERLPGFKTGIFMGGDKDPLSRTVQNNIDAFAAVGLRPRVLVDIATRSLATEVLGQRISFPVLLGPAGGHTRFHADGELATARGAGAADTIFAISTLSGISVGDIAKVATGPLWFQLDALKDRNLVEILVKRAEKAGCRAIVLTVDNAGFFSAERAIAFSLLKERKEYANFVGIDLPDVPTPETFRRARSESYRWEDLAWLRSLTRLPIVIKGIQTAEDAWLCAKHGAAGLVVSNHGGYALAAATGTMKMLPEIVSAVGDQLEVYIDGGVRTGSDVLKALALGARAVLLGRAYIWALIADGEAGVRGALEIIRSELTTAMGLCGVTDVRHVGGWLVNVPAAVRSQADVGHQVERLARLEETGAITPTEYAAFKAKLFTSLGVSV